MNEETRSFPGKLSLNDMIQPWISQAGYPLVTISRNYGERSAVVRQRKFSYDEPTKERNELWDIPLTYVGIDDDWSNPKKSWLLKEEKELIIRNISMYDKRNEETNWILMNVNKTGD
ncbi:hypothetical protein M0802_015848 [Mischocyttarus mexicanus]|nr:hypothetical protein M0802_015848 [Mischocyttarus mexicanus]